MKWKLVTPEGVETKARHGHRAVAFDQGFIVYGGGNNGICPELHVYYVSQNQNVQPMVTGKICPGVASFGMAVVNERIIIFGGMLEYRQFTNELYTLDLHKWSWAKPTNITGESPAARIGHSFTAINDNRIAMFGGIVNIHKNPQKHLKPSYRNDLYILHVFGKNKFGWLHVVNQRNAPKERDSHSAIFHDNKNLNKKFLIIFGGMNDVRLNDLWFLDLDDFIWMQFEVTGIPPEPRSLHTATLVDSKMFIFGGWIVNDENSTDNKYVSSNTLRYLNLDTLEWNLVSLDETQAIPPPRAGHCAVATYNRMYIFGGRPVYSSNIGNPGRHHDDIWFLELSTPRKIEKISVIRCRPQSIEIKWDRVENANCYLLEIREVPEVNIASVKTIKFVTNITQIADANAPRKVVVINPNKMKVEQIDGCDDGAEAMDTSTESVKESKGIVKASSLLSWGTVGIFKNNTCDVDGFFSFEFPSNFNDEMCPENVMLPKIELKTNTMYAFRVAGINSCGTGEFSKIFAFRTVAHGWPSKPANCKFIAMINALRLAWPLSPREENVKEYSVTIGQKYNNTVTYALLYRGPQPTCTIANSLVKKPEYQMTTNEDQSIKFLIFRIAATNDFGVGPYLQVQYNII